MSENKYLDGFQPLGNYALIEIEEAAEVTPGGIVLAQSSVQKPVTAKVLAVGVGQKNGLNGNLLPMNIQVGDRIFHHRHAVIEYVVDGETVNAIHEGDIIGFWRPTNAIE